MINRTEIKAERDARTDAANLSDDQIRERIRNLESGKSDKSAYSRVRLVTFRRILSERQIRAEGEVV